jgi:hypothetical protein
MKKKVSRVWFLLCGCALLAGGALRPDAAGTSFRGGPAGRISVAVRVFDAGRFVSDLSLKDFEVLEAGMPVTPEAVFLVRKDKIERREGASEIQPDVSRTIVLLFQLLDYHSKIPEALDFFFKDELLPGDTLEIQTPMRNYKLTPEALAKKSRASLAKELAEIVKKDIVQGGMAYNSTMRDLKRFVRQIGGVGRTGLGDTEGEVDDGSSLEHQLTQYADNLQKMETLRVIDEEKLLGFARTMKAQAGRKNVFYIYQREFRPEISSQTIDQLMFNNQDRPNVMAEVQSLFRMYHRSITLNHARLKQAFADSGMNFNFLFMNRPPERISGINMREQSEDIFKALNAAAEATGGASDTSQNPAASIKSTMKTSEAYYLLFFSPSTAAPPGTFIDLRVKVKGKDYKTAHRAGYLTGSR